MPELASLGSIFRSTRPVALTESETEYLVECTKHILDEYIVLEFAITNTITDQLLTDVCLLQRSRWECAPYFICKTGVSLEFAGEGSTAYEVISSIKVPHLRCGAWASVVLRELEQARQVNRGSLSIAVTKFARVSLLSTLQS